ncbi:hypothetical protein [Fimbriiglobus ruber]|uniref:Uncharacterized protein n=1 Tax=Fimbriiglobus ruber TaxID=1908690 RepID=A0A225CY22_9BACT|nr:hypothetical protein [Fimbriiglobus ruber]OWK34270.1 hypothetical protein FRUB_10241 [Fimbriiglobus ruber]
MNTGETLTLILIVLAAPAILLYDYLAYRIWGNNATISYQIMAWSSRKLWLLITFVFAMGALAGHFFIPQHVCP